MLIHSVNFIIFNTMQTFPHLYKLMYLFGRKRSKRNNLCVLKGGKMTESDFQKYNAIANEK